MADDNFDIDDIQLVKHNPDMISPEPRTSDTPESPAPTEEAADPVPAPAPASAPAPAPAPAPVSAPAPAPVSTPSPAKPDILVLKKAPPVQNEKNSPIAANPRSPLGKLKPLKQKSPMKIRKYGLGCFFFSLIVSLLLGSGTAAVIRYKKPIVKQLKKVEKWMNDHGLAFDGGDAPWKRKTEKK